MAASGRVAPITGSNANPAMTKFGKSVQAMETRANASQVVALKFSPMHSNEIDRLERSHRHPISKSNGHYSVQMSASRSKEQYAMKSPVTSCPWYKSSIIKLIGSFFVGIVCLSIVAAAVMIRTDSSRDQASKNSITPVPTNQVKRSAAPEDIGSTSSAQAFEHIDSEKLNPEINEWLSSGSHVPVPINVVIDPKLMIEMASKKAPLQPEEVQSSNVDIKQSLLVEEKDSIPMVAAVQTEKSHADQYVIEMDIKVQKKGS